MYLDEYIIYIHILIYKQIKQNDSLQVVSRKSDRQERKIINKEIFYTECSFIKNLNVHPVTTKCFNTSYSTENQKF